MKSLLLILVLLMSTVVAEAQVAIINDKDGYTNVRNKPNGQAEIICRVNSNSVFWYNTDESKEEWVKVFIPKNDFSFCVTQPDYVEGFIHRSRLLPLEKCSSYTGANFTFKYVIEPFALKKRIVDKHEGKWIIGISGRPVWGTDGNFPKTQVKEVVVSFEGQQVPISRVFYEDIYECTNTFNIYKNGDTIFVYQWNSDGAGAYQIVWVFTKEGLKQRLVGSMI